MATTTTNFGWTVPSDTDLVKDGAAAIRTALGGVDTSFVDLKGGTTGQVLAKNSNTDLDFVWSADASGIPATIFDAKGDLIAASAADTAARLAVGTNGQVLTANSAQSTGLEWKTISVAPSFSGCMLFSSADQTVPNNTFTAVQFSATDYIDTDGYHDPATNNTRITIPTGKDGKYLVINLGIFANAPGPVRSTIYKNGGAWAEVRQDFSSGRGGPIDHLIMDLVAGDYIEFYALQFSGGDNTLWGTTTLTNKATRFGVQYLGV